MTKKLLISIFVMFSLIFMVSVSGLAAEVTMTKCTVDSISIKWTKAERYYKQNGKKYVCTGYRITDNKNNILAEISGISKNSYTFKNQPSGIAQKIIVYPLYKGDICFPKKRIGSVYVNTLPTKPKDVIYTMTDENTLRISVSHTSVTGIQVKESFLGSNKKKYISYKGISKAISLPYDTTCKFSVRTYYKNPGNKKTYYSEWTSWTYIDNPSFSGISLPDKKGFKLSLKKCSKLYCYKIYLSKNRERDYVKVAEIKANNVGSVTIDSSGGKSLTANQVYYVKIVPVLKENNICYTSKIYGLGSIYIDQQEKQEVKKPQETEEPQETEILQELQDIKEL